MFQAYDHISLFLPIKYAKILVFLYRASFWVRWFRCLWGHFSFAWYFIVPWFQIVIFLWSSWFLSTCFPLETRVHYLRMIFPISIIFIVFLGLTIIFIFGCFFLSACFHTVPSKHYFKPLAFISLLSGRNISSVALILSVRVKNSLLPKIIFFGWAFTIPARKISPPPIFIG